MSSKQFDINDLFSIWSLDVASKGDSFQKLHVESNPILIEVFNMTRTVPVVIDVKKMAQKYVGVNPKEWWGWSLEEMYGEGVKSFINFIHPDDLAIQEQANLLLTKALERCNPEEKQRLKMTFNFRLKKSNGQYIHILQLNRLLEMDKDNNAQTFLVLLQEINLFSELSKCYIRFSGVPKQEKLYEYRLSNQELVDLGLPSKREKEIIGYLLAGQDSQQIADLLFISKHTIDTHRRRILQKFHLKNTQELTLLVSMTHLLDTY